MEKIKILGTRFTILCSNDLKEIENEKKTGYLYCDTVQRSNGKESLRLKREAFVHSDSSESLGKDELDKVLQMIMFYWNKSNQAKTLKKHSYYQGVIEGLSYMTGLSSLTNNLYDQEVMFKSFKTPVVNARTSLSSKTFQQCSPVIIDQKYDRYTIYNLIEDLYKDGASVIIDDNLFKYNWQSRTTAGEIIPSNDPNIKLDKDPIIPYVKCKVVGVQGNQSDANVSIRMRVNVILKGQKTDVLRNLTLVRRGTKFQNYLAVNVSNSLKSKFNRLGFIDSNLVHESDVVLDLSKISVTNRKEQKNITLDKISKVAGLYQSLTDESNHIFNKINFTKEEKASGKLKSEASKYLFSKYAKTKGSSFDKKPYSIKVKMLNPIDYDKLSQDELRELYKKTMKKASEAYSELTKLVYGFRCSKKPKEEFFSTKKRNYNTIKDCVTTESGTVYETTFKL